MYVSDFIMHRASTFWGPARPSATLHESFMYAMTETEMQITLCIEEKLAGRALLDAHS